MGLKVIVTGASGMVGEGVAHECIQDDAVEQILIIGRKSSGIVHPKVSEIVHQDFFNISPIESRLKGYDACFFCLGVSSLGLKEPEYFRLTHTLTLHVASVLSKQNPEMVFCYISGANTDSTEKGRSMWARVKGKTENDLMKLSFKRVYAFRPGIMRPTKGLKNTLTFYKYTTWLYPIIKALVPKSATTLKELGLSMIHVASKGSSKQVIEVSDIIQLCKNVN